MPPSQADITSPFFNSTNVEAWQAANGAVLKMFSLCWARALEVAPPIVRNTTSIRKHRRIDLPEELDFDARRPGLFPRPLSFQMRCGAFIGSILSVLLPFTYKTPTTTDHIPDVVAMSTRRATSSFASTPDAQFLCILLPSYG